MGVVQLPLLRQAYQAYHVGLESECCSAVLCRAVCWVVRVVALRALHVRAAALSTAGGVMLRHAAYGGWRVHAQQMRGILLPELLLFVSRWLGWCASKTACVMPQPFCPYNLRLPLSVFMQAHGTDLEVPNKSAHRAAPGVGISMQWSSGYMMILPVCMFLAVSPCGASTRLKYRKLFCRRWCGKLFGVEFAVLAGTPSGM
jgi:hypothetical protein